MQNKIAKEIKDVSHNFNGTAKLFYLSDSVKFIDVDKWGKTKFVIVSSVKNASDHGGAETFIFPSDAEGEVLSWRELQGSTRGEVTPEKVLFELGNFHVDKSRSNH